MNTANALHSEAGGEAEPSRLPAISVVIATRRRETRLAFALEALAAQTLDKESFEVLVVRDGDAAPPLVQAPAGLQVEFLTRPGVAGPAAKRNTGWRRARGWMVAFTDDDCRPHPQWLEVLLAAAEQPEVHVIQGRTEPDPDETALLHGFARSQRITGPSGWFQTCNMAYRRELLEELGGFDEALPFGGEDTDLGYRAIEHGAKPEYADDALVWHAVMSRTIPKAVREAASWREMPEVAARHPGLREVLYLRVFWAPAHAKLPLALFGLFLTRRSRVLGGLCVIPYLGLRVGWHLRAPRLARQLLALPIWIAIDAIEILSRIPAAARHRVLVI